ncbi:dihydrofolate reductase [bacterium]|nr:dihydrofolate reductase [bacterium]
MIIPRHFSIVVAADLNNGIGIRNGLPWKIKADMAYFKTLTSAAPEGKFNVVIMGRKTFESLPDSYRPLPGRMNVVITRQQDYEAESVTVVPSLEAGLARCASDPTVNRVFVIGGGQVYDTAILHHKLDAIYLTRVVHAFECDTVFPAIPDRFKLSQQSGIIDTDPPIQFEVWRK